MNQIRASIAAHRSALIIASIIVAIATFLYRFTSLGFGNDHFVHLARAQAMLAGDLPIRDYTEEGVPLTVLLSAAAQLVFGQSLLAEAVLTSLSFAAAAGVTCWLTSRVTGSLLLGTGAAILQVLAYPRSYSHPKMLVYPVFLLIAWWYLNAPGRRRVAVLAAWTAISFLIRHDHGVYIGLATAATIAVAHWRDGVAPVIRRGVEYGFIALICVAPYLAYVQYHLGLVVYFRSGLQTSAREASLTRLGRLTFDLPAGWVTWKPVDPAGFPGIRVRWKPDVDDARRQALEHELRLIRPEHAEGRTWKYLIEPPGRDTLSQLVSRSEVEDTSGFDRSSLRLNQQPGLLARLLSATKLDRLARIEAGPRLSGLVSAHNVSVAFFFAIRGLPLLAVLLVVMAWRAPHTTSVLSFTLALSALVAVSSAGLLRDSLVERIPDVYGSLPILFACVIAIAWTIRPQQRHAQMATAAALIALSSGFVVGTMVLGRTPAVLARTGIREGPLAVWQRTRNLFHYTDEWASDRRWTAASGWKIARYVHDCTNPDDRLLLTWFAPEINVYSHRVFAGGEAALMPAFRQAAQYEPSVLARLSRQSVPIVLAAETLDEFHRVYPALSKHLGAHYHKAGEFVADGGKIQIFVETSRPQAGIDEEFGWPCFAAPRSPLSPGTRPTAREGRSPADLAFKPAPG
jgi:hypothetical protein